MPIVHKTVDFSTVLLFILFLHVSEYADFCSLIHMQNAVCQKHTAFFVLISPNDTGTFNPLDQITLCKTVQNDQRKNDQQAARVGNRRLVQVIGGEGGINTEPFGNADNVGKQPCYVLIKEQIGIEGVGPLPCKGKQENRDHHRHRQRKNDTNVRFKHAGTVYISGFFQFVGNTFKELTHHKNIQTILKCQTTNG